MRRRVSPGVACRATRDANDARTSRARRRGRGARDVARDGGGARRSRRFWCWDDAGAFRGASARRAPPQAMAARRADGVGRDAQSRPARRWMTHLLRDHPEMRCTQIPSKPVIVGGDGGGAGKPLMEFLRDSNAVTFGPTDKDGNSDAERLSGLDDMVVDVMAFSKRLLYEPDDLPMDLQADLAKHLCDMFARQEKWLHPGLTMNGIQHDQEVGRWGWKDPLAMYLVPIWRDVYGPSVTYVHLVRDPRTLPLGNLHDKERDLQKAYFGQERWEQLSAKFESEWAHLSEHQSMTSVKKDDVIDLLRTTAYWTSINFELGALIKGPLKNYATVLRAEDLVQPDMDHFRRDATGKKPEKYQAAQKVMQELTTLLALPAKLSNTLGSHEHMKQNLRRFTIHREKFVYRTDSPIIEVQTRIAEKTLALFGYSTDAALFVSRHPSSSEPHGHRLTPEGEYMHEEHRYTPDDFEPTIEPASAGDLPGITDHVLGAQLKYTDRVELERAKTSRARHGAIARRPGPAHGGEEEDLFARNHQDRRQVAQGRHRPSVTCRLKRNALRASRRASRTDRSNPRVAISRHHRARSSRLEAWTPPTPSRSRWTSSPC